MPCPAGRSPTLFGTAWGALGLPLRLNLGSWSLRGKGWVVNFFSGSLIFSQTFTVYIWCICRTCFGWCVVFGFGSGPSRPFGAGWCNCSSATSLGEHRVVRQTCYHLSWNEDCWYQLKCRNPVNNGTNYLSSGAGCHLQYVLILCLICSFWTTWLQLNKPRQNTWLKGKFKVKLALLMMW